MKRKVLMVLGPVVGIMVAIAVTYEAAFWGRVLPGVRSGEVNLGNLGRAEAEKEVEQRWSGINEVGLVYGTQRWSVDMSDINLVYEAPSTVARAMAVGRKGNLVADLKERWGAWREGVNVNPTFSVDEDKLTEAVARVAKEIDIPAQEPEIAVDDAGVVNITPGENGVKTDEQELKTKILMVIAQVSTDGVAVPLSHIQPKLSDQQLTQAKKRVETLMNKKLTITEEAENLTWEVSRDLLVIWLDPTTEGGWKRGEVENWVAELAATVDRPPQNASFRFMGGGRVEEFRPAKSGYRVKQAETTDGLVMKMAELEKDAESEVTLPLIVEETPPAVTTGDVNDLGINELLGKGESWYAGSITNRIYNLKRAADALNGTLVAPGEIFSFNKTVGEISSATGYKQAYIIKEGQTILGDGGGVCQTSSTLFRAILAAGLPIEARTAHAYRVSYYEQNYQVGFDATVFQPAPDLKFRNDTPGYVLIQTEYDETKKYLAFLIYGTSDRRKVELSKSRVWEVTQPPPDLYIDDPNLPVGKVVQTEHRANGAKVAFDWKVTRGDEILIERTFYSNYRPWQAVYLRGTKTQ